MNRTKYEQQFIEILEGENRKPPYDNTEYINYVKLNQSRIKRWTKKAIIIPELIETMKQIQVPQHWVLITEPWCGDAANSHAFIIKLAELNPNIILTIQNRDTPNSEIDDYLTNGGRSIPKLIIRDEHHNDLYNWGPRPKEAQEMVMNFKDDDSKTKEEKQSELQKWYNKDKGQSIQQELVELMK